MLLRVVIFLFAFNAIVPTALAVGSMSPCKNMMDNMNSMLTTIDSSIACNMPDMDQSCGSIGCASNCMTNITPALNVANQIAIVHKSNGQPHFSMPFYYHITYPVQTPPPLV